MKESDYGDGLSVFDLFNEIILKIEDQKIIRKMEDLLFKIGGENIAEAKRFNEKIALDSLKILLASDIPSLDPKDVIQGITEVKFKSDCSSIKTFDFSKENQKKIALNHPLS